MVGTNGLQGAGRKSNPRCPFYRMLKVARPNHLAGRHVQSRIQRGDSMTQMRWGVPLWMIRRHREERP